MCTDGVNCRRRVCFFAHADSELRQPEEDNVAGEEQQLDTATGGPRNLFATSSVPLIHNLTMYSSSGASIEDEYGTAAANNWGVWVQTPCHL
jgi:hypothetical protein